LRTSDADRYSDFVLILVSVAVCSAVWDSDILPLGDINLDIGLIAKVF